MIWSGNNVNIIVIDSVQVLCGSLYFMPGERAALDSLIFLKKLLHSRLSLPSFMFLPVKLFANDWDYKLKSTSLQRKSGVSYCQTSEVVGGKRHVSEILWKDQWGKGMTKWTVFKKVDPATFSSLNRWYKDDNATWRNYQTGADWIILT